MKKRKHQEPKLEAVCLYSETLYALSYERLLDTPGHSPTHISVGSMVSYQGESCFNESRTNTPGVFNFLLPYYINSMLK